MWQSPHWPNWRYDLAALAVPLAAVSRAQGLLLGRLADVGMALRDEASLSALTQDVVQTSAIEGETLSVASVRSSVARRLGVDIRALAPVDRHVEGVVDKAHAASEFEKDIQISELLLQGILHKSAAGGRSTGYEVTPKQKTMPKRFGSQFNPNWV